MTFYQEKIYPHLVDKLGDPLPIRRIRQRIIPLARGEVLEIGAGSGTNFPHYDPDKVSRLYALEPNPGMIKLAERQKLRTKLNIEFLGKNDSSRFAAACFKVYIRHVISHPSSGVLAFKLTIWRQGISLNFRNPSPTVGGAPRQKRNKSKR